MSLLSNLTSIHELDSCASTMQESCYSACSLKLLFDTDSGFLLTRDAIDDEDSASSRMLKNEREMTDVEQNFFTNAQSGMTQC